MFQKLPSLLYLSFLCMTAVGLIIPTTCSTIFHFTNETDRQALLVIKSSIVEDPFGFLNSWNESLHFCQWEGVTCSRRHQRVTELDMSLMFLVGSVSPHVGNLTFLRSLVLNDNNLRGPIPEEIGRLFRLRILSLANNSFQGEFPANLTHCSNLMYIDTHSNNLTGEIPINLGYLSKLVEMNLGRNFFGGTIPTSFGNLTFLRSLVLNDNSLQGLVPEEIGRLFRLRILSLANNSFQGEFPANLTHCPNLMYIDTHSNNLTGEIPINLGYLSKLVEMGLGRNRFSGTIPTSFGNLSSLLKLSIEENNLSGSIPFELGRLSRLESLSMGFNILSGIVPPALFNISSIDTFSVTGNSLHGTLPTNLGVTLPNLKRFDISYNNFQGPLPTSIANASGMVVMDIQMNAFVGSLPKDLGRLYHLQTFRASDNSFGTNASNELRIIFTSLSNCSNLGWLDLRENQFKDSLPSSVGNLSTMLSILWLDKNYIFGSIPPVIGNLINLASLGLGENMLTGRIPDSIGNLSMLVQLYIHSNNFSGNIPYTFGNLTWLSIFNASNNMLEENIPVSLGNCRNLQLIDLARNHLTGHIPDQLFMASLISISLSQNYLTGNLPLQVGYSENLGVLQVSDNNLSGIIPSTLGSCVMLEFLYLQGNLFEGDIPASISNLRGLQALDLSRNKLSGQIFPFLGGFVFIKYLNLSYNNFEGEVPNAGIFRNISAFSVVNNAKLCGGIKELQLPACPSKGLEKNNRRVLIALVVTLDITAVLINISVITYCRRRRPKQQASLDPPLQNQYTKLSYADLFQATDGFASFNLIGRGTHGSIFQGILSSDEQYVAVKVLNLQQHGAIESFIAESEALRSIRHRNLVKIITSCSSIDFKGDAFKALVLEFMPNGSLEKWLHPTYPNLQEPKDFNLGKRLNIAFDIASALDYLHNHCEVAIIHCDLKPSNVLLDDEFCAQVSDFGLARIFSRTYLTSNHQQSSSIGIVGSIGYIAPEYGMGGLLSTRGDMYSYGVLLLEMFTGKRPTNKMFVDSFNLHSFVRMSLPSQVMNVVDHRILLEVEEERKHSGTTIITKAENCLVSILQIGVSCSADIPRERIDARNVLLELHKIRNVYIS